MKSILLAIALALSFGATAQTVAVPDDRPTNASPDTSMGPTRLFIDTTTMPVHGNSGRTGFRARPTCTGSSCPDAPVDNSPGGGGGFRVGCFFSHSAFDDPIVWPGKPGKTHLHAFFGNTGTSSQSDVDNMHLSGNSTCDGGWLNRSGYWTPPLVYDCPPGDVSGCNTARHGEVLLPSHMVAYYKSEGLDNTAIPNVAATVVWPPAGLRMIAGDPNRTTSLLGTGHSFTCEGGGLNATWYSIPTTAQATTSSGGTHGEYCEELIAVIAFPECWDGVSLGGVLGRGHMASGDFYNGCTDPAFPVLFPMISFQVHYQPALADMSYYVLASDFPRSAGYVRGGTLHADWLNGWSSSTAWLAGLTGQTITDVILAKCNHISHNCEVSLIGDPVPAQPLTWYRLY